MLQRADVQRPLDVLRAFASRRVRRTAGPRSTVTDATIAAASSATTSDKAKLT